MYIQIVETDFLNQFYYSTYYKDHFTSEGLSALYDYIVDLEEEIGEIELDVIALCCEYGECTIDELKDMHDADTYDEVEEYIIAHVTNGNVLYRSYEDAES